MVVRFAAALIVLFWLTMTALLVRIETHPETSRVLEVPVTHVMKLLFTHGQASHLQIQENGRAMGRMSLYPKRSEAAKPVTLEYTGSVWIRGPSSGKQRVSWDGVLQMSPAYDLTRLSLTVRMPDHGYATTVEISPSENEMRYSIAGDGQLITEQRYPMTKAGAATALSHFGMDERILDAVHSASPSPPVWKVKPARYQFHGDAIDAFVMTLHAGEIVLGEIYVSQLGQVLSINTPLGYSLTSEDVAF